MNVVRGLFYQFCLRKASLLHTSFAQHHVVIAYYMTCKKSKKKYINISRVHKMYQAPRADVTHTYLPCASISNRIAFSSGTQLECIKMNKEQKRKKKQFVYQINVIKQNKACICCLNFYFSICAKQQLCRKHY